MLELTNQEIIGFNAALRGMRNPMNSWDKSDSEGESIGKNDLKLALNLASCGPVHAKYRRMIIVYVDILAPLYWWKEFDTYKVGTVVNSCSTMHKIHTKEFTPNDFSYEYLSGETHRLWINADGQDFTCSALDFGQIICDVLNHYRELYLKTGEKKWWWQMIQLLPSSYNQKRTVMINYEVLSNIYQYRKNHKLNEWHDFCKWIETLPNSELITGKD